MSRDQELVLYLDTTTSCLMMGLERGDSLIVERSVPCDSHRYHSALIVPAIQEMLRDAGFSVRDLTALGVNHGPGSFTGIRTGIITVRTLAQFLNVPVHVFNMFELLAPSSQQPVDIWLDALRGRIYRAVLHFDASGPVYLQVPGLGMVEDALANRDAGVPLKVSPSLADSFNGNSVEVIAPSMFTPAIMVQLRHQYPERFARSWREVKPFYLQEPSITLKKAK